MKFKGLVVLALGCLLLTGCNLEELAKQFPSTSPTPSPSPSPSPTPSPTPSATPTPTPTATPSPTPTGGLTPPNHPLAFGYYFVDGKYGDYYNEVNCYTDLYMAHARAGYESSSETPNSQWLPVMEASLNRAARDKKQISLGLQWQETSPQRQTPMGSVINMASKVWNNVSFIELADEPGWTKSETEQKIREANEWLKMYGLSHRPMGIVYTQSQVLSDNSVFAQGLDWIGIEAYVDAPGSNDPQVNVNKLNTFLAQAKARIPQDKKIIIVMQAYTRNFNWTNIETLKKLQEPAYLAAYDDPRVIALTMFAYGRPSGTRDTPQLRPIHRKIGNAILNKNCQPGD